MCTCARLLLLAALPALAGRGWYGADGEVVSATGPGFAPGQSTVVVAARDDSALLDCRVLRLGDKMVSWVRSRDLQILSHAGIVFTADARVSASSAPAPPPPAHASTHTLRIDHLRASDAGRYECQVNTEPKLSLFFNLTVLEEGLPMMVISSTSPVVEAVPGEAATLSCEARYEPRPDPALPLPPLDIRWLRHGKPLTAQSAGGGVSLETERWSDRAVSRLTLAQVSDEDAGRYLCALPAADAADAVTLRLLHHDHIEQGEAERMQLDQSAVARVSGAASSRDRAAAAALLQSLLPLMLPLLLPPT